MRKALVCAMAMAAGLAAAGCSGARPVTVSTAVTTRTALATAAPSQRPSGPPPGVIARFRWSVLGNSPLGPRSEELLTMAGDQLVELGGLVGVTNESPGHVSPDAAAFDPATGRWRRLASIPGSATSSPDMWSPVSLWTGRDLLVANGPLRSCAAGCWTGAALFSPAEDRWSTLTAPKQLDGLTIDAAAWTGTAIVVAAVDGKHERLGVGAYNPATRRWQVITPTLPKGHPTQWAELVAADGRIILWSLWDRVTSTTYGSGETAGVDVLAMRQLGTWRDVTGDWPQNKLVVSPVFTGTAILLSPGQIWCGNCIPPYTWNPGYFADPVTLARTVIPAGPLGEVNPQFIWTGDAIIADNADAESSGPGGQIRPGDLALWDPATGHWTKLRPVPGSLRMSATPVWTGTELLAVADNGQLLAFHH